jgi:hypothetical protein
MRVPKSLADAFGPDFQNKMGDFLVREGLVPGANDLESPRFLSRSVIPHVERLSELFNRKTEGRTEQEQGLDPYWTSGSNPKNLRLAYFLAFMPPNLFRVASVWAELHRLGFRWPEGKRFSGIEFGAGPATGACGISAGEHFAPVGLPKEGTWALLDQDKPMLQMGERWSREFFEGHDQHWATRLFHRRLDLSHPLLPPTAPKFNLWLMSYFFNEATPEQMAGAAERSLKEWERHVDDEGLIILVEPALKQQSRRLLEFRRELLALQSQGKGKDFQILLPCLGDQACGALADPDDWCHEEVFWSRPSYLKRVDQLAGLDRRSLAFSYLVIVRSRRRRGEILTALKDVKRTDRLVSPTHWEGKEQEFYFCGPDGKKRGRYKYQPEREELGRGDILGDAEIRGDRLHSRVDEYKEIK